ncbi:hypothetical protein KM043_013648 [Ampulex compressa]|nr:hypothetical protein KM043_013648 [Ampulex compressa]
MLARVGNRPPPAPPHQAHPRGSLRPRLAVRDSRPAPTDPVTPEFNPREHRRAASRPTAAVARPLLIAIAFVESEIWVEEGEGGGIDRGAAV